VTVTTKSDPALLRVKALAYLRDGAVTIGYAAPDPEKRRARQVVAYVHGHNATYRIELSGETWTCSHGRGMPRQPDYPPAPWRPPHTAVRATTSTRKDLTVTTTLAPPRTDITPVQKACVYDTLDMFDSEMYLEYDFVVPGGVRLYYA